MRMSILRDRQAFAALVCTGLLTVLSGCGTMNGYVMNDSGRAYYERGNYAMARHEFQRAVMDNPNNPDYMANLASAMKKQGDLAGSERVYRQALHVDPTHQPSYHGLAELLVSQNRHAEAHDVLDTWAQTQPYSAPAQVEMAWYYRQTGNPQMAARSLQQALKADPNNATALAHLGQIYQDSGRPDQAVAFYQRSLHSDWYQPEVQSRLATIQGRTITGRPLSPMSRQPMMAAAPPRRFYASTGTQAPPILAQQYPLPGYGYQGTPYQVSHAPVSTYVMPPQQVVQPAAPTGGPILSMAPVPDPGFSAPIALQAPQFEGDPAHADQLAGDLPVVDAY